MPRPRRRTILSVLSILFAVVAVVFLAGSLFIASICHTIRRDFDHELTTPLASIPCDLSVPGELVVPVHVTYGSGHGFTFLVDGPPVTPPPSTGPAKAERWLNGLDGALIVEQSPLGADDPSQPADRLMSGRFGISRSWSSNAIARAPGSPPGQYRFRLAVTHGAPGLAGTPHRLVVMNDLCGCELVAPFFGWITVGVGGFLSVVAAILSAFFFLRLRLR